VGSAADEVAKGGQQLEKDGCGMGFGVRSDGADGEPCQSMQGGFAQWGVRGSLGRCERCLRRRVWPGGRIGIGFRRLGLRLGWEIEQLGSALPQVGEGVKRRAHYAVDCIT
jgi:hypothetical protein